MTWIIIFQNKFISLILLGVEIIFYFLLMISNPFFARIEKEYYKFSYKSKFYKLFRKV